MTSSNALKNPSDILILSNAPGELATWVRPVVKALRQEFGEDRTQTRISVVLSPCPHSTGEEAAIALNYPQVDRVQAAPDFFAFLLKGKTSAGWDWYENGIVIFLGGDQFYPLIIGKRLGYKTLIYAEWEARWYRYIDAFAVMNPQVKDKIPAQYQKKCLVVGDLIADIVSEVAESPAKLPTATIGLLPGSKPAKLMQGVPLCLAIAEDLSSRQPELEFVLPVAPTINAQIIWHYAQKTNNPLIAQLGNVTAELICEESGSYLLTSGGTKVYLIESFPAYQELLNCKLCVTTVGANTAELGSLGIPMIVLLPTQQLDAMRSWDGIPGLLANLPLLGSGFAKLINILVLKQKRLFAWPNIWAKKVIVPELVGKLQAAEVAAMIIDYLQNPQKLAKMRQDLLSVRGNPGAATKIAALTAKILIK